MAESASCSGTRRAGGRMAACRGNVEETGHIRAPAGKVQNVKVSKRKEVLPELHQVKTSVRKNDN